MSLATLRSRLTRLEHDQRIERLYWQRWYHGHVVKACDQAARAIELPPDRHRWFLEAVEGAWVTLAPRCPTAAAPNTTAGQATANLLWDAVDTIMAQLFDPPTVAQLDDALVAASQALG